MAPAPRSFAKSLFLGELREDLVVPFPRMDDAEVSRVQGLLQRFHDIVDDTYDPAEAERAGWVGDDTLQALGEEGFTGLYIDPAFGGLGLSQTAYCRVSEEFGRVDPALAVVLGVHQSIGAKTIHLFGTDEQKQRWLPDLAAGRRLAGFALTEPTTGSDAYDLQTRAEQRADGSWVINGEKRWIGNGNRDVVTVFARSEEHGHVALVVEGGPEDNEGFDSPFRYDTMGLKANDLRHLTFRDVVVPAENLLGEPGDGFEIAVHTLNNGRMSLGTGSVGAVKHLLDMATRHVTTRRQFGRQLADFELVQEKLAWMAVQTYGLESLAYLTTGMEDAGIEDVSLESAMLKVAGTEFLWYAANRAFQLAGGEAYITTNPYEKILRDIRVFPIFEGSNDVLRAFVALQGLQALGRKLEGLQDLDLTRPVRTTGLVLDYVVERVRREISPERMTRAHRSLEDDAAPLAEQIATFRQSGEHLLRRHGDDVVERQWQQKRLAEAAMDITAQVATLSRLTDAIEDQGDAAGTECFLGRTFVRRARQRVHTRFDRMRDHDDEDMHHIAELVRDRGGYGFELY